MEVGRSLYARPGPLCERAAQAFRSRIEAIRIGLGPGPGNFVGSGFQQRRHPDKRREPGEVTEGIVEPSSGPAGRSARTDHVNCTGSSLDEDVIEK